MKFGIFGDIHGNLEALEAVLEDMEAQAVRQTVCVGDIVGQCANPRECLEIVRALGSAVVMGEQDRLASAPHPDEPRRQLTEEQREFVRAQPLVRRVASFTAVHASLVHPDRWDYITSSPMAERSLASQETAVGFFGHTHVPQVFIRDSKVHEFFYRKLDLLPDRKYFVNVGSVGEPRDGDWRAAYVVYDSDAKTVELRRLPYDLAKARAKMGWRL